MVPIYIIINFVQLFHFTIGYVNLAVNKMAWQTSTYSDNYASNAVDGNTNQKLGGKSCAVINKETASGTWRVDLERILSIHHITIYYRNEVSTWRMAGFFLYVSNTTKKDDGHLCFHELQTSPPPYIMSINCTQHARYVIYYNERNRNDVTYPTFFSTILFNELCEVEVYGCDFPGFYGENCSTPCPINCKNKYCYIVNGTCLSCIDGYQGLSCKQICSDSFYGENCRSNCGHCLNGETCNHINGSCRNGCAAGWNGPQCLTACAQGTYGLYCKHKCNTNCKNAQCNHVDGKCTDGCETGYDGNFCENDCPGSTYGENCGSNCGHCLNDVTCHHVSGTCKNGCAVGWKGNKCDSVCDSGTYGLKCNRTCNVNCYSNTGYLCHHVNGNCTTGCQPGWQSPHCDQVCDSGTYGLQCNRTCNVNCYSNTMYLCHHVNGNCTTGCKPGWQSPHCDQVCDPGKYGSGCNQSCNENCNGTQNTCDHATGECINGCKPGWKGEKCDTDASTDESVFQLQRTKQSNILLIGAIVGWVFNGIFIVSLIIFLTLFKLRKKGTHKDNREIYDDINMDRRDEHHVYSSITSKK